MQKKYCYLIGLASLMMLTACGGSSSKSTDPVSVATSSHAAATSSTAASTGTSASNSSAAAVVSNASLVLPASLEVVTK